MKNDNLLIFGGAAVLGLVVIYSMRQMLPAAAAAAGGLLTGDNALTHGATDSEGNPVTAYQGAGVFGTLGAAANAASGGTLASLGQWLGGKVFDLVHGPGDEAADSARAKYAKPPATTNGGAGGYLPTLSFYNPGASFKDLTDPASVNPWSYLPLDQERP